MTTYFYSNPTSIEAYMRALAAQDEMWVTLQQMTSLLNTLRTVNFASRDSRNAGLEALLSIVPAHPYRITGNSAAPLGDIRFSYPANGVSTSTPSNIATMYVNLDRYGWSGGR